MNRRNLIFALPVRYLPVVLGLAATLQGKEKGKGQGKGHGNDKPKHDARRFRQEDQTVIVRYYDGPRDLPPGLRKKYYKTGKLPPGWEKKLRPFPIELVQVLPPLPPSYDRGYIDGVAIVYDRNTRIILDAIDLVAAIAGR